MTSSNQTIVPAWARGTFIWKLCLADRADALVEAAEKIGGVANQLDHAAVAEVSDDRLPECRPEDGGVLLGHVDLVWPVHPAMDEG